MFFLAKFGFDTAENRPHRVCPKLVEYLKKVRLSMVQRSHAAGGIERLEIPSPCFADSAHRATSAF